MIRALLRSIGLAKAPTRQELEKEAADWWTAQFNELEATEGHFIVRRYYNREYNTLGRYIPHWDCKCGKVQKAYNIEYAKQMWDYHLKWDVPNERLKDATWS